MSIRKLFLVSSLVLGIGISSTCSAIEIYTCKINPTSPMVGGVRTGVLENQTGRPVGSCTGREGWRAGANTTIPESSFKGKKIDTNAFSGLSGYGCICVTEPCPCAHGLTGSTAASAMSPAADAKGPTNDDPAAMDERRGKDGEVKGRPQTARPRPKP